MTTGPVAVPIDSMDPNETFDRIVGLIYEAAIQPSVWKEVAVALSEVLDGQSVTVWLRMPDGSRSQGESYRSHETTVPESVFEKHLVRGLPWGSTVPDSGPARETLLRFVDFDASFPNEKIRDTAYFKEWLSPRGLAPASPIAHVFAVEGDSPRATVTIQQRADLPPIEPAAVEFADRLVPHLARAYRILDFRRSMLRERDVFREVLDRVPTGMVLIDENGRIVTMNESARLSVGTGEGLQIHDGRPMVSDPEENRWLQNAIDRARDPQTRAELEPDRLPDARRQKDAGQSPMFVTPLAVPASESTLPDTAAMILLGNPKLAHVTAISLLRSLYDLTKAEADLTWLLTDGLSLEEAAQRRNVTLNTARSQLKRVFAKTGAKRQADLVRIVLGGAGALRGLP